MQCSTSCSGLCSQLCARLCSRATSRRGAAMILTLLGLQLTSWAAAAVELTVDPARSRVSSIVGIELGCPSDCNSFSEDVGFSGTLTADVEISKDPTHGVVVSSVQVHSSSLGLSADRKFKLRFPWVR